MNVRGWIHGLEAVTLQLANAWHEVAVMERLFPSLPGMTNYQKTLRRITKKSNDLLLTSSKICHMCSLTEKRTPGSPSRWRTSRKRILKEFITARDAFVSRNEEILLDALGQPCS